jgi:SNF2 family DNA or RNA helicase
LQRPPLPVCDRRRFLAARWRAGESSLFLISLKAGGTSLNLSKADYVIQLDPW